MIVQKLISNIEFYSSEQYPSKLLIKCLELPSLNLRNNIIERVSTESFVKKGLTRVSGTGIIYKCLLENDNPTIFKLVEVSF